MQGEKESETKQGTGRPTDRQLNNAQDNRFVWFWADGTESSTPPPKKISES
jgi:hypothetical protein